MIMKKLKAVRTSSIRFKWRLLEKLKVEYLYIPLNLTHPRKRHRWQINSKHPSLYNH